MKLRNVSSDLSRKKISIIGTVGVPANYGGFETLAEQLVFYHSRNNCNSDLTIWCSAKNSQKKSKQFLSAELRYVNLNANGFQSIFYDIVCISKAVFLGHDRILLLGVSGALFLPFVRLCSHTKIITNIDGIEWKRDKWNAFGRLFLKFSERLAIKWSHEIISDNQGIADYVEETYRVKSHIIAYGGDQSLMTNDEKFTIILPESYCLSLCRIEPENNVAMILETFSKTSDNLVFIGNWDNSDYGLNLKRKFTNFPNIELLDPIYDSNKLYKIRSGAAMYIHGHSAGGTNPSLVEMMHFGVPVVAFGCNFNVYTTENMALYFKNSEDLLDILRLNREEDLSSVGVCMSSLAQEQYTWEKIGQEYFTLLQRVAPSKNSGGSTDSLED